MASTFAGASDDLGLSWPRPLFPYQIDGVRALLAHRSLLLADEMGLGKTIQAIAALRVLFAFSGANAALIVAPVGLVLQWRRELRQWAPELRLSTILGSPGARTQLWRAPDAQVFLCGYETIRGDRHDPVVGDRDWDVVILDEAQRIKNPNAEISWAIKQLRRHRSWALTGTPLENRLDDLLSVLDFVAPGRFDPSSYALGLRRLLGEVQMRRRRVNVLEDLPPKLSVPILLDLAPAQRLAYERAERDGIVRLASLGTELRINHVLELILRLKQICNFCPETGASSKLADLRDRLAEISAIGERALVFSQFRAHPFGIERVARELADYDPLVLSGQLSLEARADVVREFERNDNRRLMLLSLRAGGVGLNLTAASYVFHFDRWWNPAVETQGEDRAYRIGQTRTVTVYAYLCANTVEERIAAILADKRQLFTDLVEGVSIRQIRRLDLPTLLRAIHPRRPPQAAQG
ncbi:MAG: DEAD/DEAH box helicase [Defluviicoccus sp.]